MTAAIIVDIDGTIANNDHRQHHLSRTDGHKPDWDAFYGAMADDTPVRPIIDLLWNIQLTDAEAQMEILYATGRPEEWRRTTEAWLYDDSPAGARAPTAQALYMRATGDYRADYVVKEEILARIIAEGYRPIMAIDDRKQVVDMWRRKGLICLQCAEGDF